jgi:hypothetical protein
MTPEESSLLSLGERKPSTQAAPFLSGFPLGGLAVQVRCREGRTSREVDERSRVVDERSRVAEDFRRAVERRSRAVERRSRAVERRSRAVERR